MQAVTKIIVLKAVKYGESSLILTCFTELYGLVAFIVKGTRSASKKSLSPATLFIPGSIIEASVNYNQHKSLQYMQNPNRSVLHTEIQTHVIKNAVVQFYMELIIKALKQPEQHPELFYFIEDILNSTESADAATLATLPLFFTVHFTSFLGLQMQPKSGGQQFFDLEAGQFAAQAPPHQNYLDEEASSLLAELINCRLPQEAASLNAKRLQRWSLLNDLIKYYQFHIQDFSTLKTLPIVHEILQ